jgi:uncharacterized membrane protein YphA (DoxX/SURF4 family)
MKTHLLPFFKHSSSLDHSQILDLGLWSAQVVLALLFGFTGYMKVSETLTELATTMPWTLDVPGGLVRFIGTMELLGALGLLLPALTRRETYLVPLAGLGLGCIMGLAVCFHLLRGEFPVAGVPAILGLIAAFVAWGRFYKEPIEGVK